MSAEATATVLPTAAATAALTQPAPGALPTSYVESDPAQRSEAQFAHFAGIFGILGTGIYNIVKRNGAGAFARDQMSEAFNFHLLAFCTSIVLNIVGAIAAAVVGALGLVFSLAAMAVMVGALALSIINGLKAGRGQVARYPARLSVLK